jgi:hypothetical protein
MPNVSYEVETISQNYKIKTTVPTTYNTLLHESNVPYKLNQELHMLR